MRAFLGLVLLIFGAGCGSGHHLYTGSHRPVSHHQRGRVLLCLSHKQEFFAIFLSR